MSRSNYLRNKLIDHVVGGPAFVRPVNLYFALMTVLPTGAGGGTEIAGGGYVRKQIPNDTTFFETAAAALSKTNTQPVEYVAAAGADWGTVGSPIIGVGVYDAPTGGNLLEFALLTVSRVVPDGAILTFLPGDLTFEDVA